MNIFLPYENNIVESVQALDDLRLQKQLVEVYQLLVLAIREQQEGHEIKAGHYHHPIYLFYKNNIKFLAYYGWKCCEEYLWRFHKSHKLRDYFMNKMYDLFIEYKGKLIPQPQYIPYYMEGSKGQPNYIRTTENVGELFKLKLIVKWESDKSKGREPKWTNREVPKFYTNYLNA